MMETTLLKREKYVDVVAGIMISWMILGHCNYFSHFGLSFYKYLGFFMPWFFYKSGMFFSVKDQTLLLKKDASKLLRYFVVYSLIGWLVWCICGMMDGSLTLNGIAVRTVNSILRRGNIVGNGALWFLVSLFIVRQLANWILKKKVAPPIVSITCFALAFALYAVGWYRYSWWFGNVFSGACFFLLGYWIKGRESDRLLFPLSAFTYCMVLIASIAG
jgi:fucose 4-O-acetylase-like acetyltransferase